MNYDTFINILFSRIPHASVTRALVVVNVAVFVLLAAVSMNYYLLHQNLAVHLKRLGVPPSVSAEPNRAGEQPWQLQYTLLCFGLSLLGAALITLLIEKPCAKVLKKMFARGKAENKA